MNIRVVEDYFTFPFQLHKYQLETIEEAVKKGSVLNRARVGCVDGETEYLTPDKGWVKIKDYTYGDYVCQVDINDEYKASFVLPINYIDQPGGTGVRIKNKYGIDQVLSDAHKVLVVSNSKYGIRSETLSADKLYTRLDNWQHSKYNNRGCIAPGSCCIPTACKMFTSNPGIPYTNEELRLMVAVIADGSYKDKCGSSVVVRLKKEHKKNRLRELLNACNLYYRENSKDYKTAQGFTTFDFKLAWRRKEFPVSWVSQINEEQAKVICDEVMKWDAGSYGKRRQFFSRIKQSAEFIQLLFTGLGINTSLRVNDRERDRGKDSLVREIDYIVSPASSNLGYVGIVGHSKSERFSNSEKVTLEREYCFTVPTGFLLMRRNNRIFVTGNCGKSIMSIYLGLYYSIVEDVEQILISMPPSLIDQWEEFLGQIEGLTDVLVYRGSPEERKEMDLTSHPVVLVSDRILVRDFKRFTEMGMKHKLFIIGDELSLKSSNQTYKCWKNLIYRRLRVTPGVHKPFHRFCALNATPVSKRDQVYWWCSLFRPEHYASQRIFKNLHVAKEDNWGTPLEFMNLEIMDNNFDSLSVIPENTGLELPEKVFTKIPYSLEKKHKELYEAVLNAEFDKLNMDVLGAVDAMFSVLQRVVLVPREFGLDIDSPVIGIINSQLDQMDEDDKVIIYTRHVIVTQMLAKAYGDRAVAVYGKVGKMVKRDNIRRFKAGEAELMIANLDSLSKGQNLQVANQTIFTELPFRSDVMEQACGRTARQGQEKSHCFYYLPVAKATIQVQICNNLLANDMDLRKFNNNKKSLKEYIYGT